MILETFPMKVAIALKSIQLLTVKNSQFSSLLLSIPDQKTFKINWFPLHYLIHHTALSNT